MGGAHLVNHAAGWLEGGLTASFEKLILDAEMLQMMAEYLRPIELSDDDFTTINAVAGNMILGDAAAIPAAEDAGVGEYELMWTSEWNSTNFRYWRLVLVAAGTSPSITFSAYTSKRQ